MIETENARKNDRTVTNPMWQCRYSEYGIIIIIILFFMAHPPWGREDGGYSSFCCAGPRCSSFIPTQQTTKPCWNVC